MAELIACIDDDCEISRYSHRVVEIKVADGSFILIHIMVCWKLIRPKKIKGLACVQTCACEALKPARVAQI